MPKHYPLQTSSKARAALLWGLCIVPVIASPVSNKIFLDGLRHRKTTKAVMEKETNLTLLAELSKIIVGPNIPLIGKFDDVGKVERKNSTAITITKHENYTVVDNVMGPEKKVNLEISELQNEDKNESRDETPHEPHGSNRDTTFSIVNSTPYRWRRGYCHSYQLSPWCDPGGWPDFLAPGKNFHFVNGRYGDYKGDGAGEVIYHLEGTSAPMSFMINRTEGKTRDAYVSFRENFETKGNGKGSEFHLDLHDRPAGANFIVSGTEGNFYSVNSPAGWMQSLWEDIKYLPLRELVMPRSHHSGLWKTLHRWDLGHHGNTVTQEHDLEYQMKEGGIRIIDFRPMSDGIQTYESHGSYTIAEGWSGVAGESLRNMIAMVNNWQDQYPGELIIWDIHPDAAYFATSNRVFLMRETDRRTMYGELKLLKNRLQVPDDVDLTQQPLASFIDPKQSGVLIRVDSSWLDKGDFPGGKEGFVSGKNFPYNHRWSDTERTEKMTADQIKYIKKDRSNRGEKIFVSDWLVTQKGIQVLGLGQDIIEMNRAAYSTLYSELWNNVTDMIYPNWISMDGVHSSELKDIAVAINYCLAARKCGDLGGKVTQKDEGPKWTGAD